MTGVTFWHSGRGKGETSYLLRITCDANRVRTSDAVVAVKASGQAYLVHEGLSKYNYGVDHNLYNEGVDNVYADHALRRWRGVRVNGHAFLKTHSVQ